ncbi:MAG: penicillin-binding protein 2 [Bacteroidia bacterium]|nr:penicillin-binding protein 2 [Bacteroidia bacterium]MDW8088959.1 penicillin-binding protein 2 [Bacteroidia bacterium]
MSKVLKRFYLLLVLVGLGWVGLGVRLGYLQWKYQGLSPYEPYANRPYLRKVRGERGTILARDNTVLATSMPLFRLAVDPTAWQAQEVQDSLGLLAQRLASLFPQIYPDPNRLHKFLWERWQARDRHVYLLPYKYLLTYSQKAQLAQLPLLNGRPRALIVEKITHKRSYPYGGLARATLGYLVSDSVAWRGLESAFHEKLRGEERSILVQRLPNGLEVPLEDLADYEPQPGADLYTTLNPHLQDIVAQALARAVERHKARGGVAILMEVRTGEILALANWEEKFNDAVFTLWEPGSTFKVATAAALLELGLWRPPERLLVPAALQVADRTLSDGRPALSLTLEEALTFSSNVAFATACYRLLGSKPETFYQQLAKFHLLSRTGISLYGEPEPTYIPPHSRQFNSTTLPWLSIGYNIRLTPLQLLSFYNAIANNGVWVPPRLVREIRYPNGESEIPPLPPSERILSERTARYLRQFLRSVVEKGTAKGIYTPLYAIAGKTGTAKKVEHRTYVNRYRASFVGFFPAEQPLYSCIVVIDDPQEGGFYGGEVAAPVFREIADAIVFRDLRIAPQPLTPNAARLQPTLPILPQKQAVALYNELNISTPERPPTAWVKAVPTTYFVRFTPYKPELPQGVVGMSLRQAWYLLRSQGYEVFWTGEGPLVTALTRRSPKEILLHLGHETAR